MRIITIINLIPWTYEEFPHRVSETSKEINIKKTIRDKVRHGEVRKQRQFNNLGNERDRKNTKKQAYKARKGQGKASKERKDKVPTKDKKPRGKAKTSHVSLHKEKGRKRVHKLWKKRITGHGLARRTLHKSRTMQHGNKI